MFFKFWLDRITVNFWTKATIKKTLKGPTREAKTGLKAPCEGEGCVFQFLFSLHVFQHMLLGQVYSLLKCFHLGLFLCLHNLTEATPVKTSPCAGLVTAAEFHSSVGPKCIDILKANHGHLHLTTGIVAGSNKYFLKFMFQKSSLLLINNGKSWNVYHEEFQKPFQIQAKKKKKNYMV